MTIQGTLPESFNEVIGLGSPISFHPAGKAGRWVSLVFGILMLGASALLVLYGLYDTYVQVQSYGPAVMSRTLWPPIIIGGVIFLVGVLLLWNAITNWKKAAAVYERGLAYNSLKGMQTWRWDEVHQIYSAITKHYTNGIYTGTTYIYTLVKQDGEKLVLNNSLAKIEDLGNTIQKYVAPIQYEKLVSAIKAGQTVSLGPVSISHDTLAIGKKSYPWSEISEFTIRNGFINIKKKDGGWFSGANAAASSVPNLNALLGVINQIVGIK